MWRIPVAARKVVHAPDQDRIVAVREITTAAQARLLLETVRHGCAAGAYQEALGLYQAVNRVDKDAYRATTLCRRFGLMSQEIEVLYEFLPAGWDSRTTEVGEEDRS